VTVTPHVAALSMPADVVGVFVANLQAYVAGGRSALRHVIDGGRGY
jgi:hypothetical protein